jgi:hypothetical protein
VSLIKKTGTRLSNNKFSFLKGKPPSISPSSSSSSLLEDAKIEKINEPSELIQDSRWEIENLLTKE